MTCLHFPRLTICLFIVFLKLFLCAAEENFLLIDGMSHDTIIEFGPGVDERMTPCSTFKIALSLMGFDSGILIDEENPVWLYQEGYDDFLESWKSPQTPRSWLKVSCIWYSKMLTMHLGMEKFQTYLTVLDYGNHDASGGLTNAWLTSSLKISPREQVTFLQKMIRGQHRISSYAVEMTKKLLFLEEMPNEWKLFGKTGWSRSLNHPDGENELRWFVGWIEHNNDFLPFAYNIRANQIDISQTIPRVKQLVIKCNLCL